MRLLFVLFVIMLLGCKCATFPPDIAPNTADQNYREILFQKVSPEDVSYSKGSLGITVREGQDLYGYGFVYQGFYTGDLKITSQNCQIDPITIRYSGKTRIMLKDLITGAHERCIFDLWGSPDKIDKMGHDIREIGTVSLMVIPDGYFPATIAYVLGNEHLSGVGQASIQMMEGLLSNGDGFTVATDSKIGYYSVDGCGKFVTGSYTDTIDISYASVFGKKVLKTTDSCQLLVMVRPTDDILEGYMARFDINVYSQDAVLLENPDITYKNEKLEACGKKYAAVVSIDDNMCLDRCCKEHCEKDKTCLVQTITTNGRKNVIAVKNGEIIRRY